MAEKTGIEWTDSTFNPWMGCTKVGPGCDHCYAEEQMDLRWHRVQWGPGKPRVKTSDKNWRNPHEWNEAHSAFFAEHGRRRRVFCASLADVFDNEVDPAWRASLFAMIGLTPNLDWLILTKRVGNVSKMLEQPGMPKDGLPSNVWLGATVVNQEEYDRDIGKLMAVDASIRFLSVEPMLGSIKGGAKLGGIDWVIVGGESGPHARPIQREWVESLQGECEHLGIAFFFKQWGGRTATAGGCELGGVQAKAWPIREERLAA